MLNALIEISPTVSGSLPDLARDVLQRAVDSWFHWLLISSAIVALGVACEAWEATISLRRWYQLHRGKNVPEPNERSWAISASYLGLLLVIAGVVGEGVFEARVSNADTALRRHDLEILAHTQEEVGDAELRASELELRAATLEEQLMEVGPRNFLLYGKREEVLLKGLHQFEGQKVQIRICQFNVKEVRDTAARLTALFELAKWKVSPGSPDWGEPNCLFPPDSSPTEAGIWVGMGSQTPTALTRQRASKLLELLRAIPLAAKFHKVFVETVRSGPDLPNRMYYDSPDSIVVSVLPQAAPMPSAKALKLLNEK